MILPLKTTLVISQVLFILNLKTNTDLFTLNVIECITSSNDHKLAGVAGDLLKINNNTKIISIGSARPEVRGTAEPHGGAYPP